MSKTSIRVGEAAPETLRRTIYEGLCAFNDRFLGPADHRELSVLAQAGETLLGGLVGETGRGWLHIGLLWVSAARRGQGLGRSLLLAAEAEARARGCGHALVATFDFQARPFYERQGYRLFATLDGYPNGHQSFYLRREL